MAAVAKITCNEMSNRVTSEAIQLHGGFGFTDEFAVSRLYRGARYGTLGGGTSETLRDLIGKRIMDAADTGAELLAFDMMSDADLAV
jgi:alkylation response protein AidB-like acyl-CoA dehydrogenase